MEIFPTKSSPDVTTNFLAEFPGFLFHKRHFLMTKWSFVGINQNVWVSVIQFLKKPRTVHSAAVSFCTDSHRISTWTLQREEISCTSKTLFASPSGLTHSAIRCTSLPHVAASVCHWHSTHELTGFCKGNWYWLDAPASRITDLHRKDNFVLIMLTGNLGVSAARGSQWMPRDQIIRQKNGWISIGHEKPI